MTKCEQELFDAILWWSKETNVDFDWENFRDTCLGKFYRPDMNAKDVVAVTRKYFAALIAESKFETGNASFDNMILAPCEINMFMRLDSVLTLEEVLNSYLRYMLNTFRFARCDWYKNKAQLEKSV